ncbi:MAG: hypothetical protein UT41_C0002G0136 [Candidatus Wolfebacteria bacterium GW2011_GWC2_39_22]|uniref:Uncharacterized protein n=2 Tax=Candidatus Wolfeibacteriota TaxID=1752735 RepID=A0A0G1H905_9BACT|nr:MAG: hypothetical protein UT41_C0002G0136 [Candidatus Wolfebacteria bacterium GW2011_GWC2_39_22]KKT43270.1 MAG: hypothetical protein UW32_C0002G0131 [Candidatus Wolfebacteria bacterium GW2011_GWE2_44_13]
MSELTLSSIYLFALLFVYALTWFFPLVVCCLWFCDSRYRQGKRVPEGYYAIHHSGGNFLLVAWISLFFAAQAWFVAETPGFHRFGNLYVFVSCICMYAYCLQDSFMRRGPSRLPL